MGKKIQLPYELISKIPKYSFANIFTKKYPIFEFNSNKNTFRDNYFQNIKYTSNSELKYIISSYFIIQDEKDNKLYDIMISFQYKKYFINEYLLMDIEKSKKCKNCYVWDYKINLIIPSVTEKFYFKENRCGSKILFSNNTPKIFTDIYNELEQK